MNNQTLITSSGIIRNKDKARVGVISQHSVNSDFLDEVMREGINVSYMEYLEQVRLDCEREGKTEEETEETLEKASQDYLNNNDCYLFGDWKEVNGRYEIDRNGKHGFAGTWSTESNLCVWNSVKR